MMIQTIRVWLLAWQMGGIDMAAIQKWNNAKVIRYHVEGAFASRVSLATTTQADITDRVTLDFDWDTRGRKPIGDFKFTNAKSTLMNPGADKTKCAPPKIHGAYEHLEVAKVTAMSGGSIELKGTRSVPAVDDPQWPASCDPKATAGKTVEAIEFFALAEPQLLALPPTMGQKNLKIAADKKSYALITGGWTWKITPTVVQ